MESKENKKFNLVEKLNNIKWYKNFKEKFNLKDKHMGCLLLLIIFTLFFVDAFIKFNMPNSINNVSENKKIKIVATSYPMASLTQEYFEDSTIDVIFENYEKTFSYAPTPIDVEKVNNADIFIYNGDYYEPWVKTMLKNDINNNDLVVIDASTGIVINEIKVKEKCLQYVNIENPEKNLSENNNDGNKNNEENNIDNSNNNSSSNSNNTNSNNENSNSSEVDNNKDGNNTNNSNNNGNNSNENDEDLSYSDTKISEQLNGLEVGSIINYRITDLYNKLETLPVKDNHVYLIWGNKTYKFYRGDWISTYDLVEIIDGAYAEKKASDDIYFWMNFDNLIKINDSFQTVLMDKYPENKENIISSHDKIEKNINKMKKDLNGIKNQTPVIFISKINFASFLRGTNINFYSLYNESVNDEDPSTATLNKIINAVKENNISAIFTDENKSGKYLEKIEKDSNASVVVFDSMTLYSKEDISSKKTFLNIMKDNVENVSLLVEGKLSKNKESDNSNNDEYSGTIPELNE